MAGPVPRNYPDIRPFIPKGYEVKEHGGIVTIKPTRDMMKERYNRDCHDHYLNCLDIERGDSEVEIRRFAVIED